MRWRRQRSKRRRDVGTKDYFNVSTLPPRCPNCGADGSQRHFIYGLAEGGFGEAVLYCAELADRDATISHVAKKHGSAIYWSRFGWSRTGPSSKTIVIGGPTHVYHFYDNQGNLIYVGITNDLQRRWAQHAGDKPWWHLVARKESMQYPTRQEAEKVEAHQIRIHQPLFNRAMNGWVS